MSATGSHNLSLFQCLFKTPAQHKKLLFITVLLQLFYISTGKYVTNNHFDYLIFSQRWLPTACIEYMEHHSSPSDQHHCIIPKNYASWAIHGLWPTQYNHMGPFFCNRSLAFDINKIVPIESELKLRWPNIEEGKGLASLWQHEWEKHGTCSAQLESLNSEIKYFSTALKFSKILTIQDVFTKSGVLPSLNKGINVLNLFTLMKNAFGSLPQIHCIQEVKTKKPFLSEIRFCYKKNLELMDCGNISKANNNNDVRKTLTNCPLDSEVIYPVPVISKVEDLSMDTSLKMDYYNSLVKILSAIRFLQWVSI